MPGLLVVAGTSTAFAALQATTSSACAWARSSATNTHVLHPPVEAQLAKWAKVNGCKDALLESEKREWRAAAASITCRSCLALERG